MYATCTTWALVRQSTRRSRTSCRSRRFKNSPWWEKPSYILEAPIFSTEGDDSVPSPVFNAFQVLLLPFAGAVRAFVRRNMHDDGYSIGHTIVDRRARTVRPTGVGDASEVQRDEMYVTHASQHDDILCAVRTPCSHSVYSTALHLAF